LIDLYELRKVIRGLRRSIALMIGRGVVRNTDDSTSIQTVQVEILKDDIHDLERFQNYGYTSVPLVTSEAVVVFPGGSKDHGIIVAVDDRRYRLRGLENGEVAIYTDEGDNIVLKRGNKIEANTKTFTINAEDGIILNGPITTSSTISAGGNVSAVGSVSATVNVSDSAGSMAGIRTIHDSHAHSNGNNGSPTGTPI